MTKAKAVRRRDKSADNRSSEPTPGKHSRVQRRYAHIAAPGDPSQIARSGFSGDVQSLPHEQQLQSAFGPDHDVSDVPVYVGGPAAAACGQLGARAYAFEGSVAFAETPDLHLAAHEAAHVVQQRSEVRMSGDVSHAGDACEIHADAVADAVVAGQSAAALLSGGWALPTGIQREEDPDAQTTTAADDSDAQADAAGDSSAAGDADVETAGELSAEQAAARAAIIERAQSSSVADDVIDLAGTDFAGSGIGYLVLDPEPSGGDAHGDVYEIDDYVKVLAQVESRNLIVVSLAGASGTSRVAYGYAPVQKTTANAMVIDADDTLAGWLYSVERTDEDRTIVRGQGRVHGVDVSYVLSGPAADEFLDMTMAGRVMQHDEMLWDDFRTTAKYTKMLMNMDFAIEAYKETERGLPWFVRTAVDVAQFPGDVYDMAMVDGVTVTVVDDSDFVGWVAAASRTGEVTMTSPQSMVDAVIAEADGEQIAHLNILDHGNAETFQLGDDWVGLGNIAGLEPVLSQLTPHFAEGASVHLQHCNIGQNHELLIELAQIWGVSVYAGTEKQNPLIRSNYEPNYLYDIEGGQYERCDPDGNCISDVDLPYGKWGQ